jgi:23S rRNA pseudouridine955/2504/2580 synthase
MNTTKTLRKIRFEDLIVDENDQYIIVNKPPHLSTLSDRNDPTDLLALAKAYHPSCKVCHRLDKETSGILIVAKTDDAYRNVAIQLEHREVTKMYHALVEGRHEMTEVELDKPLYSSASKSRIDFQQGKPSLTMVSTVEIYKQHTLLACMPFTGRLHQIRVHLADAGFPICGDEAYGGKHIYLSSFKRKYHIGKNEEEQPLMQRVSLHAAGISFKNLEGEMITQKAPYPKDMHATIRQLAKNKI